MKVLNKYHIKRFYKTLRRGIYELTQNSYYLEMEEKKFEYLIHNILDKIDIECRKDIERQHFLVRF